MIHSLLFDLDALHIVIILFFSMLAAVWIGYKIAGKKTKVNSMATELLSPLLAAVISSNRT